MLPSQEPTVAEARRCYTGHGFSGVAVTELIRTNDIVLIGFARSLLEFAEIPVLVADEHMSLMEGSIGAFGRRLLVPDDHGRQARRILREAGLAAELRDEPSA